MNPTPSNTRHLRNELRRDLGSVAQDIEELIEHLGNATSDQNEALRAKARNALDSVRDIEHNAQSRIGSLGARAQEYVHANPWRVVGAAAATAYALGFLSRPRH